MNIRAPRERRPLPDSARKWTMAPSPIASVDELLKFIENRFYIFTKGRRAGYHWSFVANWQLWRIKSMIDAGQLFAGIRNPRMPYEFNAVFCPHVERRKSVYLVSCHEIGPPAMFQHKSHAAILEFARRMARNVTGEQDASATVTFDDRERP